jgi:O-acetyl-ADP-ribose deacetylase (regulator of RNase III)
VATVTAKHHDHLTTRRQGGGEQATVPGMERLESTNENEKGLHGHLLCVKHICTWNICQPIQVASHQEFPMGQPPDDYPARFLGQYQRRNVRAFQVNRVAIYTAPPPPYYRFHVAQYGLGMPEVRDYPPSHGGDGIQVFPRLRQAQEQLHEGEEIHAVYLAGFGFKALDLRKERRYTQTQVEALGLKGLSQYMSGLEVHEALASRFPDGKSFAEAIRALGFLGVCGGTEGSPSWVLAGPHCIKWTKVVDPADEAETARMEAFDPEPMRSPENLALQPDLRHPKAGCLLSPTDLGIQASASEPSNPWSRIQIVEGDITQMETEAIVNAANKLLRPGGGVCGAIHHAAGPELAEASLACGGCRPGEARLTPGFKLKAKWVIHAVGPVWAYGQQNEDETLASAYRSSLDLCEAHQIASVAFPLISTGSYGYPMKEACAITLSTITDWLSQHRLPETVAVVAFDSATAIQLKGIRSAHRPGV